MQKYLQFATSHRGFVIPSQKQFLISTIFCGERSKHAVHMVQVIFVKFAFKSFQKTIINLIPPE